MRVNEVYEGDCIDVLKGLPDNSVDSIITDPPYGLEFMGQDWDHGIPGVAYWIECLRVAKPGATLMAFGGTRTHHRLMVAIEDAGWEVRDCINYFHDGTQAERSLMASLSEDQLAAYLELHRPNNTMAWTFGSGFPKSCNISKNIDRAAGMDREVVGDVIRLGDKKAYPRNPGNNFSSWEIGDSNGLYQDQGKITAPSTSLAKEFDGYGSALKPAYEPIIMAMKPMGQSYADNAEEWGLAGLWIDGARVGTEQTTTTIKDLSQAHGNKFGKNGVTYPKTGEKLNPPGRYPANIILGITGPRYQLRPDITPAQAKELAQWLNDNTKEEMCNKRGNMVQYK